jgi:hypothetical protein
VTDQELKEPWTGAGLGCLAGLLIFTALGIWIHHFYLWLRYGISVSYTTAEMFADLGFTYPATTWVGLERAIDWVMTSPAPAVLIFFGLFLGWIAHLIVDDHRQKREFAYEQRRRAEERPRIEEEEQRRQEQWDKDHNYDWEE